MKVRWMMGLLAAGFGLSVNVSQSQVTIEELVAAGDMVMGFSGSSATNYIGAYYSWRLADGTTSESSFAIQVGVTSYTYENRWGDFSATTLDPTDDWSFWTIQEFSGPKAHELDPNWRTVISLISPNP